jgi:hypothetical protein
MTLRAVLLGLLLGGFIASAAYFNDFVVRQAPLINHLLPIVVLGAMLALVLMANPLLATLGARALTDREIAVVAAIGLVACSYPEAGFYRTAPTNLVLPTYQYPTRASWQGARVLSYVPGGPAELGDGHVRDWAKLARRLVDAGTASPDGASPHYVAERIWHTLPATSQMEFQQVAERGHATVLQRQAMALALNRVLADEPLSEDESTAEAHDRYTTLRINRALLREAIGDLVLPPPPGDGALLLGGRIDPRITDPLVQGGSREGLGLTEIPWRAWWPSIRLWGGAAVMIGLASLCLALIVHPQWSRNELLSYPIARFVNEATFREHGRVLPKVALSGLFWWGLGGMVLLHLVNGLAVWQPDWPVPAVPLRLDFRPLSELFPNAARIGASESYFWPTIFFSVIAFAFFLPVRVSFSIGLAPILFVLLGVAMLQTGRELRAEYLGAESSNMLRFGAYLGVALMIAYTGRRYYSRVIAGAIGWRLTDPPPPAAIWAARGLIFATLGATAALASGGLHWSFALATVLLILLVMLVLARIVAETGLIMIQPYWMPVAVLTAFMGFDAIGPTAYILLALASTMIIGDTRTAVMANVVNALQLADRSGARPSALAPWLGVTIVATFIIAGVATLYVAYNFDAFGRADNFTREMLPAMPFDQLVHFGTEASATGTLAESAFLSDTQRWWAARPDPALTGWALTGLAVTVLTAVAALRLPWWPLHPVAFLIWGTYPSNRFAFCFFLACFLKAAVMQLGGPRAYQRIIPLMVGVIAGEVFVSFFFLALGAVYFLTTGLNPAWYTVF